MSRLWENRSDTVSIDILALPDTTFILLAAVIEPLRAANRITGRILYDWRLLSLDGAAVETTAHIRIPIDGRFEADKSERPLFVVSSYNWQRHSSRFMKTALAKTARYRHMVAGVESGTWLLAEAGLLDNYKATIHFEDYENFSSRFPQIEIVADRFVIDRQRMTSGGALPTLDMMLEIVRRRQGHAIAVEVSRSLLYERGSSDREVATTAVNSFGVTDRRLAQAVRIMEETVGQPLSVETISQKCGLSARHLQTLFQKSFGAPPNLHYLALRLNVARRNVIETDNELAAIATQTGFNSPAAFSRAYRAQFSESPSETRRRAVATR